MKCCMENMSITGKIDGNSNRGKQCINNLTKLFKSISEQGIGSQQNDIIY